MRKVRNERLTAARLALAPGINTQQAVAEAISDLVHTATGKHPPIDADYISKLERGEITWPGADYRIAFRRHFGVSTDADLGFYSRRTSSAHPPAPSSELAVDDGALTRDLVPLASLASFGALQTRAGNILSGIQPDTTVPDRVGHDDVQHINQTTDLFEHWDFLVGGGLNRNAVIAQLQWTRQLHQTSSITPQVRRALQSAIARLGEVAGWMSFDAGDNATARRCWLFALDMAAEADDWPTRVNILMDMARQATYTNRPNDGLNLMRLATSAGDQLSATVQTAVHVVTARAHGALGHRTDCLRHIGQAETMFGHRDTAQDPPWIWYYTAAQLAGDCGHALFDLALHGQCLDRAISLFDASSRLHGPEAARSHAFDLTKLATLQLLHGDLDEAATTIGPVLEAVPRIRSRRLTDDLRVLRNASTGHPGPQADLLRRRVAATLRTSA